MTKVINGVEIEPDVTQKVLAEMLCENTGRHMLDSGGAYGRNWERNQGITVEDFINSPRVFVEKWTGPMVNVFHYLDAHLTYDEELDNEFQEWMEEDVRKDETYFSCVYEWCEKEENNEYIFGGLTYNSENNLSQDFQADVFSRDGEDYLCLSIHGGCDIRGGYTKPRIFQAHEYFMMDIDSWTLYCNESTGRKGKPVILDWRHGELYDAVDDQCLGGYYTKEEDDPLVKWANLYEDKEGYPTWDEDNKRYNAPDGDGYIEFDAGNLDW
jgi:hypothetical protein